MHPSPSSSAAQQCSRITRGVGDSSSACPDREPLRVCVRECFCVSPFVPRQSSSALAEGGETKERKRERERESGAERHRRRRLGGSQRRGEERTGGCSSAAMGDGKESERQPLLKNENINYSSSEVAGMYESAVVSPQLFKPLCRL